MDRSLVVNGLTKTFRSGADGRTMSVHALRGVTLELERGEIVGLVGPARSGKSTFLLCAAGLVRGEHGTVSWFGESVTRHRVPTGLAYVPQRGLTHSCRSRSAILRHLPTSLTIALSGLPALRAVSRTWAAVE